MKNVQNEDFIKISLIFGSPQKVSPLTPTSSVPSRQSHCPLHLRASGMHFLLLHSNCSSVHSSYSAKHCSRLVSQVREVGIKWRGEGEGKPHHSLVRRPLWDSQLRDHIARHSRCTFHLRTATGTGHTSLPRRNRQPRPRRSHSFQYHRTPLQTREQR